MGAGLDAQSGIQIPGIPSGGKTGHKTHGEDHSIFIMLAPFDDPQIAVAAMVENAGYGATAAGPIASLMAEFYLTDKLSDSEETKRRVQMAESVQSERPVDAPSASSR